MDLRFGDPDRFGTAEPAAIDFRAFVATLAAAQASSAGARAAAGARRGAAVSTGRHEHDGTEGDAMPARHGAFHAGTARALGLHRSATELKTSFTVAFQPSFKAGA